MLPSRATICFKPFLALLLDLLILYVPARHRHRASFEHITLDRLGASAALGGSSPEPEESPRRRGLAPFRAVSYSLGDMDSGITTNGTDALAPRPASPDIVLAMNFVAEAGRQMLASSTSVSEVEERLKAFLPAVGLEGCAIDASLHSINLSYWKPGQAFPITIMQTVEDSQPRLDRLTGTISLLEKVERGDLSLEEAFEGLWTQGKTSGVRQALGRGAVLLSIVGWVLFLGGTDWATILVALLGALLTFPVDAVVRRLRLPAITATVLAAVIIAAVPNIAAGLGLSISVAAAVVGGLFRFLPGRALVSAVSDGLANAPVSAIARAFEALITAGALALGVAVGSRIGRGLGVELVIDTTAVSIWLSVIGAAVGVLGIALAWGMPRIRVIPTVAISAIGWTIVSLAARGGGSIDWIVYFLAAVLVGFFGMIVSYLQGGSASAYTGVAILPLVPGFTLYLGVLALTMGLRADAQDYLTEATAVSLAIASGVAIGLALGRNLRAIGRWIVARRLRKRPASKPGS